MTLKSNNYKTKILWLIAISTLIRLILASLLELGNDEVYYRLYALYPDWSHFDHPPMVGFVMQLFSLNLLFNSELALRLGSVILGSLNLWIIFLIGRHLKDEPTGWHAALLYTASIYAFIICGIFILPDTPQISFWLLAILFFIKSLKQNPSEKSILWAGLFVGLAFLSKYTSLFLWLGFGLYILLFDRTWFKRKELYFSILITLLCTLPVVIWNFQNDFISFTFHSERVTYEQHLRPDLFATELAGELLYNNPIVVLLSAIAVVACFRKKISADRPICRLLLAIALPFIVLFWAFSWQRPTLPHWSAPAFVTLIPLAATQLNRCSNNKINAWIASSITLLALVLIVGVGQIRGGWFPLDRQQAFDKMGKNDFSLDMYGWKQLGNQFKTIRENAINQHSMNAEDPIIAHQWFPAAHLDYYVANPLNINTLAIGSLDKIHKFAWTNELRGGFHEGMNGWWITSSRDFVEPQTALPNRFTEIGTPDTIRIIRNHHHVMNFYVYPMRNMMPFAESN